MTSPLSSPSPASSSIASSTASSTPSPAVSQAKATLWIAWALLIVVGLGLRLTNLYEPLIDEHSFRQTQTAWTARMFVRDGISLTHVPVPVFGPPWEVPYELPLFQACAAVISKTTGMPVDAACRLTSVLFFYLSAAALFALGRALFAGPIAAAAATALFVWSPFTIIWSRASLMEYMAVAFALLYALAIVLALRPTLPPRRRLLLLAAATVAGCIGGLVKVTTMTVIVPTVLLAVGLYWLRLPRDRAWREHLKSQLPTLAALGLTMLIPVVVAQLWIRHADAVKNTPLMFFLTSTGLKTWNYGTLEQRLTLSNWTTILERTAGGILPWATVLLPLVAILRGPWSRRLWALAFLAGAALPVMAFFNLYVQHSYYQIALTPVLALAAGAGVAAIGPKSAAQWIGLSLVLGLSIHFAWWRAAPAFFDKPALTMQLALGKVIAQVTPPDGLVCMQGFDWDPSVFFHADRRGLMWGPRPGGTTPADLKAKVEEAGADRFTTLVFIDIPPEWPALWPDARAVGHVGPFTVAVVKPKQAMSYQVP